MATLPPAAIAYQEAHIHENRGPLVIGVSIAMMVLPVLAVGLRFSVRLSRKMPLKWDDWLCIPATLMVLFEGIINIISVHYGLGKHLIAVNPETAYQIQHAGFYLSIAYLLGIFFVKCAILLTYVRIFSLRTTWFKWAIYGTFLYVTLWTLAPLIVVFAECRPISYYWQRFNVTLVPAAVGKCTVDPHSLSISVGVLNTVCDYFILLLPLPVIWSLNMDQNKKIGVAAVFMVGALACIASSLRIHATITTWDSLTDQTWDSTSIYLWTEIEASVGICCCCFPLFGGLIHSFRTMITSLVSSGGSSSSTLGSKISRKPKWLGGSSASSEFDQIKDNHSQDLKMGSIQRTDEYTVTSYVNYPKNGSAFEG